MNCDTQWITRTLARCALMSVILLIAVTATAGTAQAQTPDPNPDLEAGCGLDIVFVLDESGSIVAAGGAGFIADEVRSAADTFATALEGTGSRIAVVEFNSAARQASVGGSTGYQTVDSTYVSNFSSYLYGDCTHTGCTGNNNTANSNQYDPEDYGFSDYFTNWQDALEEVNTINDTLAVADLVVFFTDGNPTTNNGGCGGNLPCAITAANTVKADGSHIFVVGIPNNTVDEGNVQAISGTDEYPMPPGNTNTFAEADYSILTDADQLANALRDVVIQLCGGIRVIKVLDGDGNLGTTGDRVPGEGWEFTVNVDTGGASTDPVSGTTGPSGNLNFVILYGTNTSVVVDIVETLPPDSDLLSASCVDATDNGTFTDATSSIDDVEIAKLETATCTFINKIPDFTAVRLNALTAASPGAPFGASPVLVLAFGLAVVATGGLVWLRRTEVTSKK